MEQKNVQSTKSPASQALSTSLNVNPSQEAQNKTTNNLFALLLPTSNIQISYSDQTGCFPTQSSRGYQYIFILHEYDSNAILSMPLKTRKAIHITTTWTELHFKLQDNGLAPTLHILDNNAPTSSCKKLSQNTWSTFSWYHHTSIDATPPSTPSKPEKTISAPGSQLATPNFLSPNRTGSCPSRSHSQPASILMALSETICPLLTQHGIQFPEHTLPPAGHQSCHPHHSIAASQYGAPWC
jgi:hypothetical protein